MENGLSKIPSSDPEITSGMEKASEWSSLISPAYLKESVRRLTLDTPCEALE